jgi:hypothetical protein
MTVAKGCGSGGLEFTFRFSRRTSRSRGLVLRRLIEQAVVTRPVTEANVTNGYRW